MPTRPGVLSRNLPIWLGVPFAPQCMSQSGLPPCYWYKAANYNSNDFLSGVRNPEHPGRRPTCPTARSTGCFRLLFCYAG